MALQTLAPARNFTLTTDDRVRALVSGPPAYLRRLRAIEDLELWLARRLIEGSATGAATDEMPPPIQARLARLNELIARHNRFYSIEANLPIDLRSGEFIDRSGEKWRPLPFSSREALVGRARSLLDSPQV
jgi:hypothetical protein